MDLLDKKLEGQLDKPEPLKDLMGDFVAYRGQRDGSIPGCIDVYVSMPNKGKIEIIYNVPRECLIRRPPPNNYSHPGGTWVLLAGPAGTPTYAEDLLGIMPQVFQRLANAKRRADTEEAKTRILEKEAQKTREEVAADLADDVKKVSNATKNPFFERPARGGSTSLTGQSG